MVSILEGGYGEECFVDPKAPPNMGTDNALAPLANSLREHLKAMVEAHSPGLHSEAEWTDESKWSDYGMSEIHKKQEKKQDDQNVPPPAPLNEVLGPQAKAL